MDISGSFLHTDNDNKRPSSQSTECVTNRYYSELERLKTFKNWGVLWFLISPLNLARWGWISIPSRKGATQCVFCGGIVSSWAGKAGAKETHQQLFPHCPLLRHKETVQKQNIGFTYPLISAPLSDHNCGCFCCHRF